MLLAHARLHLLLRGMCNWQNREVHRVDLRSHAGSLCELEKVAQQIFQCYSMRLSGQESKRDDIAPQGTEVSLDVVAGSLRGTEVLNPALEKCLRRGSEECKQAPEARVHWCHNSLAKDEHAQPA